MKILKNIIKTSLVFGLLTTSFSDLNASGVNDVLTEMENVQNKVRKIYNQVMNNQNNKNICYVDTSDFETRITSLKLKFTKMHPSKKDDTYMQNIYDNVIQMCNSIHNNFIEIYSDKIDKDRADNQLLNEATQGMIGYTQNDDHEIDEELQRMINNIDKI